VSAGTVSLLTFQSNRFVDNSSNGFTLTPSGTPQVSTFAPFSESDQNIGSGYFDGTGDYLTVASNAAFQLGTGDFTVEAWWYPTTVSSTYQTISGVWNSTGINYGWILQARSTDVLFSIGTAFFTVLGNRTIVANQWYHVVAVRSGSTIRVFLNGEQLNTGTSSANGTASTALQIGRNEDGNQQYVNGYLADVRIIKGVAQYSANFVPATSSLTAVANTSLLTLQYPLGENNHRFVDESANKFFITRNGNATQGTFTPFSQTGWSNRFGGSTDYVAFTSIAAYGVGTGNFSVQFFVNFNTISGNQRIFCVGASGTDGINIQYAGGTTQLQIDIANSAAVYYTWTPVVGTWYQIDVVRAGTGTNQTTLYINGSSVATGTSSGSVGQNAANIGGLPWNSSFTVNGYISNVRFSNTARSISAVTTNYSSDANTLLLTAQSNRFVDNSSTGNTFTIGGTPSVQAFSPFAPTAAYTAAAVGGSGYFDGTGDYLTTPSTAVFNVGTGNFTVETWIYPNAITANTLLFISFNTSNGIGVGFQATNAWGLVNSGVAWVFTTSTMPTVGQWNHLVVCRGGTGTNQTAIFLNGTRVATGTVTTSFSQTSAYGIGWDGSNTVYNGYMSSLRVTNADVYGFSNSTITVPTAPLTAITNTTLLLNYTNAGITDATAKNDLETVGDAKISTAQSKFGGSSMYFDGTGDWLFIPASLQNRLLGDFTIEFWMYAASPGTQQGLVAINNTASSGSNGLGILIDTSNRIGFFVAGNGTITYSTNNAISSTTWTYVALVRSGSTNTLYVNGSSVASNTTTPTWGTPAISVGRLYNDNTGVTFNGYIDDLRITRGFARYTANFTPPTETFRLR